VERAVDEDVAVGGNGEENLVGGVVGRRFEVEPVGPERGERGKEGCGQRQPLGRDPEEPESLGDSRLESHREDRRPARRKGGLQTHANQRSGGCVRRPRGGDPRRRSIASDLADADPASVELHGVDEVPVRLVEPRRLLGEPVRVQPQVRRVEGCARGVPERHLDAAEDPLLVRIERRAKPIARRGLGEGVGAAGDEEDEDGERAQASAESTPRDGGSSPCRTRSRLLLFQRQANREWSSPSMTARFDGS
jgi:hypothetical protein